MPKRIYLRCGRDGACMAAGEGRGPLRRGRLRYSCRRRAETNDTPVAYRAPLRQALIDDHSRHMNVIVCKADHNALKRGIEHFAAGGSIDSAVCIQYAVPRCVKIFYTNVAKRDDEAL
jgi:hypothetical protein